MENGLLNCVANIDFRYLDKCFLLYRVSNKRGYIYRRLLIQIGISFLLYYGRVLDAKGCQFIASFSVLWNSTFLKLLVDQDILNCPALSRVNIAAGRHVNKNKLIIKRKNKQKEMHFWFWNHSSGSKPGSKLKSLIFNKCSNRPPFSWRQSLALFRCSLM